MPARSLTPTGPVPDMGPGMGLDMARAIGDLHLGTMALLTARWVSAGTVDTADSARYVLHPARLALVHHSRLTHPRNSGKNCEPGCHSEAAVWFLC